MSNPAHAAITLLALITSVQGRAESVSAGNREQAGELLLFGADWCAPCRAELAELPALARAIAPDRLILAWTDVEPRLPTGRPANVRVLDRGEARLLLAFYAEINAGLPFALARDARGRTCGFVRHRLNPADAAALIAPCRVPR